MIPKTMRTPSPVGPRSSERLFLAVNKFGRKYTMDELQMGVSTMSRSEPIASQDEISVTTAYIAMYQFIDAYWERGRQAGGDVGLLRSDMAPFVVPKRPGSIWTSDPAFWNDWLKAVAKAREIGPLANPDPSRED